jgi:F0F1-type ATP synthase assembly protein I
MLNLKKNKKINTYKSYIKNTSVCIEIVLSIFLPSILGIYLDEKFKTFPYGILVCFFLGVFTAARRLHIFTKSYIKKNKSNYK